MHSISVQPAGLYDAKPLAAGAGADNAEVTMPDLRRQSAPDQIRQLMEAISLEYGKLQECLANIAAYSDQMRRVTEDSQRRLLTRD